MYRFHHNLIKHEVINKNYFTSNCDVHSYNTRFSNNLRVNKTNTKLAFNTIKNQVALLWNNLPSSIKNIPSFKNYKKLLFSHFSDQYN